MKKIISIVFAILFTALAIGCETTTMRSSKETYNVAYISIAFLTYEDSHDINSSGERGWLNKVNKCGSGIYKQSDCSFYCHITDWEYGENDTIILYLTDGRTMQTSANNVVLMYDPEID